MLGKIGVRRRVEPAAQAQAVDVFLEIDPRQHLRYAVHQLRLVGDAGALVIDPIGVQIEFDIA